ncbi:alpha/beta hydrolase-fold protein [Hoyosella subflava]|uniref:Mycolyltransferase n=1 Tax=Hoyosella subflava (strain DSM 45089 / JCM 17490 / NBRC 109087 / DQS3-9A1) TaxID=443218 RepID=F6EEB2_HOYSD|nr:alpha/beta hydrolase-fold protein [Hoyosella subflava]AEF38564.1 Mycolyltransferase [Hoyosella subflava DQS3-9A1]
MRLSLQHGDRGTDRRSRGAGRRQVAACAAILIAPLAISSGIAPAALAAPPAISSQSPALHPMSPAPVPGVRVDRVDKISDRQLSLWVYSPAMNETIQVQMLLARDYHAQPDWSFPALFLLDGLRARDDQSGWMLETDAAAFFGDKNVNVIMPVGGQSSFYADWLQPDNDKNYQWETFLTKELPPILHGDYRVNDNKGILGLSMGGTAAMFLPARNRGMFQFAGSLSGYLSTTTYGMQRAIKAAMLDAGGFNSDNMWGTPDNSLWAEHDPLQLARNLRGMSLYVSAGTGAQGTHDRPGLVPGIPENSAGMALEVLSRLTTQNFAARLNDLGIDATVRYRNTGTHSWPYWQSELHAAWPQIAEAINVDSVGVSTAAPNRSVIDEPTCEVGGAIGELAQQRGDLGVCLTDERTLRGGAKRQEFEHGTIYWSPELGAHQIEGEIEALYEKEGGARGQLGLPTTSETPTPDGRGFFTQFEKGAIYWTPETGAQMVHSGFREVWGENGWEAGDMGYPVSGIENTEDRRGRLQKFERGAVFATTRGGTTAVFGKIWDHYNELGRETGVLGYPQSGEHNIGSGRFTEFANGNIYWSPASGAWAVLEGDIMDAWAEQGYEAGPLGYPTSDAHDTEEGLRQNFQNGYVLVSDGETKVNTG